MHRAGGLDFEGVVEVVDGLLEGVDLVVDRMTGLTARQGFLPQEVSKQILAGSNVSVIRAANILRPQVKFVPAVDNSALTQFVPHLQGKPNALVELSPLFTGAGVGRSRMEQVLPNPYEYEIQHLTIPEKQLNPVKERIYGALETTPTSWIDTLTELDILVDKLSRVTEFAVDLEAHSMRSYQGFVCLMQISTRGENFLVDALALRPQMQRLNRVFTHPGIVKVMHGADFDIQWLQRDFCIYVVNMFDTGQAARVLDFPKKSLAYLLERFCNVHAQKQYQLADWRIRPIPEEMLLYAKQDTHYLLYIYDTLLNMLPSRNERLDVWNRSRQLCLQIYQKPAVPSMSVDDNVWTKLHVTPLLGNHLTAFCELNAWRDDLARREDESVSYVLPNRMMYSLAERLPLSVDDVLSLCVPVPPLLRAYAHEITGIIHKVKSSRL